jgi:sulfur carrier protein
MHLTINGEAREVDSAKTVAELVAHLGLGEGPVAVELNRAIVPRAEHASRTIADGDVLEIVHMVGGG